LASEASSGDEPSRLEAVDSLGRIPGDKLVDLDVMRFLEAEVVKSVAANEDALIEVKKLPSFGVTGDRCSGTDVMIFKIFSPKISAKKLAFFTRNKAKLCKILIITLVFEKNDILLAENC
jgi:hypothetical protein